MEPTNQTQSLEQVLPQEAEQANTLSEKLKKFKKDRLMKEFKRKNPTRKVAQKPLIQL